MTEPAVHTSVPPHPSDAPPAGTTSTPLSIAAASSDRPPTADLVPDLFRHADLRATLRSITDGVASAAGFRLSAVSVFRNSDELEFLVVSGDEEAQAELDGDVTPRRIVDQWLAESEGWGGLRFLPHEKAIRLADHVWVGEERTIDHPHAWQPYDMLFAPLMDRDDQLQGILWVDMPLDGLRPGPDKRRSIETYARQASEAILVAIERSRLAEQVRLAAAARRVVRDATAQLDLDRLLEATVAAAREGFGVDDARVLLDTAEDVDSLDGLSALARSLAHGCWARQRALVVSPQRTAPGLLTADEHAALLAGLEEKGDTSLLLVPLGAGTECLGRMLMFRHDRADWSDEEADAALDMGHDLGRAVLNARSFAREQHAAAYTQQLIATMAHELQNPLAAARGYASILEDVLDELGVQDADARRSLRGLERASGRLVDIVTDLLALARATEETDPTQCPPVDLVGLVGDSVEMVSVQAAPRGISVTLDAPAHPLPVRGEPGDLARVASNLVGNAVKYSPDGATVRVTLTEEPDGPEGGQVVLEVVDVGIGISAADQEHLFEEFFRSQAPEAVQQPGTGLGLAIVKRVVDRHRGTITVASASGEGSTFTVRLPRADA